MPAWWWFLVGVVVFGLAAGQRIKGGGNPRGARCVRASLIFVMRPSRPGECSSSLFDPFCGRFRSSSAHGSREGAAIPDSRLSHRGNCSVCAKGPIMNRLLE